MSGDRRPPDMSLRDARDRWLNKLRGQYSENSISTYHYRLKLFVEWADDQEGIETVRDVTGWDIDTFEAHRRSQNLALPSLKNEMSTLRNWFEYLANAELVDDDLPEKIEVPHVPPEERSSDVKLAADDAWALLEYYRSSKSAYGTRDHALLEVTWHSGARAGALRSLDVRDMEQTDRGDRYLDFRHRPDTGTRLKKGINGERPVLLNSTVWDVLDEYVRQHRNDVYDEYGRQPLLASENGRPTTGTIRDWMYMATIPCIHSPCPHEKDPDTCEYVCYEHAGGCPSSRAPHQVRTGAITWLRTRGVPAEVVATRVNSSVQVIEEHYDKEDPVKEMLERRQDFLGSLDIDPDSANNDQ